MESDFKRINYIIPERRKLGQLAKLRAAVKKRKKEKEKKSQSNAQPAACLLDTDDVIAYSFI